LCIQILYMFNVVTRRLGLCLQTCDCLSSNDMVLITCYQDQYHQGGMELSNWRSIYAGGRNEGETALHGTSSGYSLRGRRSLHLTATDSTHSHTSSQSVPEFFHLDTNQGIKHYHLQREKIQEPYM
jgi:hypothetical protein